MSTRKKAREVPRAPRAPKRKGDEASPVVAPAPALPLPQLSSDDKWGRRSFMAALGFGSATLAVGILAWRFPVTPSPVEKTPALLEGSAKVTVTATADLQVGGQQPKLVVDTRLTPGTGTLRLGNVVASLDPAATHATANLVNATSATVNAVNATHATVNAVNVIR